MSPNLSCLKKRECIREFYRCANELEVGKTNSTIHLFVLALDVDCSASGDVETAGRAGTGEDCEDNSGAHGSTSRKEGIQKGVEEMKTCK